MAELLALAIEEIGASLYAYEAGATLIAYSTTIAYAVVAVGSYAAMKSMQKMPNMGGLQSEIAGRLTMSRDTVASRRIIYGTVRLSGPVIFASTTSNINSTKNENLHLVIALATHECGGLKGVYFNDVQAIDEAGTIVSTFASNLAYSFKFGTATQDAFVMDDTAWTSDHKLSGICALYTKLVANPNTYPNGIPNITAVIEGYAVPDMNDNLIYGCTNPALILRHYLLNYFGADSGEIDVDSFTTAAVVCDDIPFGFTDKRYECNYTVTLNTKPQKIIEDILKTCYGKLAYVNGKFVLKAGAYPTPIMSINEDDIVGQISVTTKSSQANAINSIRGLYVDGAGYTSSYQPSDFVPVTSSYYLSEDNGIENPFEIELSGVTNHTQARRIAKLTLLDSRQDLTVSITCKIGALRLIAGDNVWVSIDRYGWNNKVFQVNEMSINPDMTIGLVLKETASEIYDFPIGEDVDRDLSPNTNLPNPFIVPAPDGFRVSETTSRDKDGTIFPSATLNWSSSLSGSIDEAEVDYRETSSLTYTSLGTYSRTISEANTLDVMAGYTYDFRIRNMNYLGTFSSYASASIKILGNTAAPQPPSSITLTGGTGSLYVQWVNDAIDTDYKATKVYTNTVNSTSGWTDNGSVAGTSWNKTIASSSVYYVWLQNTNTSNITSSVAYGGGVAVSSIGAGATGPSGSAGVAGNIKYQIYIRSATVPTTPTGNLTPAFWSTSVPTDNGNALWVSSGLISGADGTTLIGSWSTPERLTGKVSWYQTTAPTGATTGSIVQGDLWWDTDDNYKPYRWNGTSWQAVDDGRINPISASLVSFGDQYALTVTSSGTPRIAGFRIINQSGAASDFTVQADTFRIYNTIQGTVSQSFLADASGVYMPQAFIRNLDAGKITAGTINATVLLTAAELQSPRITGSAFMINSRVGLRYQDDSGVLTITGGDDNGDTNGAQLDLVGNSASTSAGVLNLVAGNVGASGTTQGFIQFYTGGNQRGFVYNSGVFNIKQGLSFGSANDTRTTMAISNNFGTNDALTYAGGSGATGVLSTIQAHRWVNSGNSQELMALTTGGNLYVQTDVYADNFISPSSERLKTNILPLTASLDIVSKLKPVSFDWKSDNKHDTGLIAEQVQEILPHIVSKTDGVVQGLDYAKIVPYLIGAIHELQQEIAKLKK